MMTYLSIVNVYLEKIFYDINTIKFVFTKQILKENLPSMERPGKIYFSDKYWHGKRISKGTV